MKPSIDEIILFGKLDRCISELKFVILHWREFDEITLQTCKEHLEYMQVFINKYLKFDHINAILTLHKCGTYTQAAYHYPQCNHTVVIYELPMIYNISEVGTI